MRTFLWACLPAFLFLLSFREPGFTVQGKVVDENGEPVGYVKVEQKGKPGAVMTNVKGEFTITVSDEKAVLLFSEVGYLTQKVRVKGRREINVRLKELVQELDGVVVKGHPIYIKFDGCHYERTNTTSDQGALS